MLCNHIDHANSIFYGSNAIICALFTTTVIAEITCRVGGFLGVGSSIALKIKSERCTISEREERENEERDAS